MSPQQLAGTLAPEQARSGLRRFLAYLGPATLVSVGYMDPGNWATDIEGGARFGHHLLWVLVVANGIALLMQTLAARLGARSCGVILSGMGRDGVAGLHKMKARGSLTLSQEEQGCAVYGMPKAALDSGASVAALDPVGLAREVSTWVSLQPSERGRSR